jgi:D-3-phosphoglycerate dehydrogenase / 2-oxoglutarate reductase
MAITTDRYSLDWEVEALNNLEDLEIDLWTGICSTSEEVVAAAHDADALLITSREPMTRGVIEQLDRCKVISRYAVGIDHIDLDAATDKGIVVTHVPDYCTAEVADHAMALILSLNRRIVELDRALHAGAWVPYQYMHSMIDGDIAPLRQLTLGIIGLGRIGQSVARRAAPFGLQLIAYDPYLEPDTFTANGVRSATFEELLTQSDIITIHCPLTAETRGMINEAAFAQMKPTAVLVNTARGPIVDMKAVEEALSSNRIVAAALDVVDPEPLPLDSPLYKLPNLILTPHAAAYSAEAVKLVRRETLDGALRVLRGQTPRTVANPEVLKKVGLQPYA